jgi:hypothetical protein
VSTDGIFVEFDGVKEFIPSVEDEIEELLQDEPGETEEWLQ